MSNCITYVEYDLNQLIENRASYEPYIMTRMQAAQLLLDSKPNWYVQTPEGEYLLEIINNSEICLTL